MHITLQHFAAEPEFFAYLTRKHKWTPSTHHTIDWRAFRMAARNHPSSEVHLLKLVHDQLPTRSHLSKFQLWTAPQCHHCHELDTLDHLQRSSCNPILSGYAKDIHNAVKAYFLKHCTPAAFQATFLLCLTTWIAGKDDVSTESPNWFGSPALHQEQQDIGWWLLCRGMLTYQWQKFLQQTLHNDKWQLKLTDLPEYTGPHWTTVKTPSSASWLTAGDRSDTSIKLFEPEFFVEFNLPAELQRNGPTSDKNPVDSASHIMAGPPRIYPYHRRDQNITSHPCHNHHAREDPPGISLHT